MEVIEKTKEVGKRAVSDYFSDTPRWAKVVRLIGIGFGALGGAVMAANPVTLPAFIVVSAPYLTLIGNFAAIFVQGFSKK